MHYGRFYMQSSNDEWIIEHITWKLDAEKSSLPEFDSSEESAGAVYIYTPTIPETDENGNHYILSEEAILPEIYQSRQSTTSIGVTHRMGVETSYLYEVWTLLYGGACKAAKSN